MKRPVFDPRFEVSILEDAVLLADRSETKVLRGAHVQSIARLLDGRSRQAIAAAIDVDAAEVFYTLNSLEARGYLTDWVVDPKGHELAPGQPTSPVAFAVHLVSLAAGIGKSIEAAIAALGGTLDRDATTVVLVTEDELDPAVVAEANAARDDGRRLLLTRPFGIRPRIGPCFEPTGPCVVCMVALLRRSRRVAAGTPAPPASPVSARLVAAAAARAATERSLDRRPCSITVVDLLRGTSAHHRVWRRPECPHCGDPTLVRARARTPPQLHPRPLPTGTSRGQPPEALLVHHPHLVGPVTGLVDSLRPIETSDPQLHVCESAFDWVRGITAGPWCSGVGAGSTPSAAQGRALAEVIERFSGARHGDEATREGSHRALGEDAIHPNACMLFSREQYRAREAWNRRGDPVNFVPEPFDPERSRAWSPIWSLTEERFKWLPTDLLLLPGRECLTTPDCIGDANGLAAGSSIEEAGVAGFLELVERDAVAMFWYGRCSRPQVDVESFDSAVASRWAAHMTRLDRCYWVLDITTDLDIPAFAAISTHSRGDVITYGFGAHLDPELALRRALLELGQSVSATLEYERDPAAARARYGDAIIRWWRRPIDEERYLAPDPDAPARGRETFETSTSNDALQDLRACQAKAERAGLEVLIADRTRPELGVPVVKVVVPGMRHFWARYAPGRLYDVPVALGWLDTPRTEATLNPNPLIG